ncbi:MAG: hypothetical protein ABJC26_03090 [Gemmatimonadaceae bacterium]
MNGRDFVAERLEIEAAAAQRHIDEREQFKNDIQRRLRVGAETEISLNYAQDALAQSTRNLNAIGQKLSLRQKFLDKSVDQKAISVELQKLELQNDVQQLVEQLDTALRGESLVHKRQAAGLATELEVKRAEVEVLERKSELEQLRPQLQAVLAAQKYRKN